MDKSQKDCLKCIHFDGGFSWLEVIACQSTDKINKKIDRATMSRMLDMTDRFQLANNCFNPHSAIPLKTLFL